MKSFNLSSAFKLSIILLLFNSLNSYSQYNCGSITLWHSSSTSGTFLCQSNLYGTPTRVKYNNYVYDVKDGLGLFYNYTAGTAPSGTTSSNSYWTYKGGCCQNGTASAGSALSAICQSGTSAQMGGSIGGGATAGTWSGGAGTWTNASNPSTATYTAGASESGNITLTLTATGGCSNVTATKTITVNAKPTTVTVTGGGAICSGASATLNASNGASGTIYWQNTTSNGTSTGTASSSQSVNSAGTYYFRAQSAAGCWGTEGSATITINALPTTVTVTGGGAICSGASTTLNASNGGSGTIYWQNTTSNGTSTGTASSSQSVNSAGTYYFRAQSAGGCWGTQGSAVVTNGSDRTVAAASSSPSVCENYSMTDITHTTTNVTGIASSSGLPSGVTATYSSNTITISGTPTQSGTFNYTITPSGCGSATATGTITVTPALDPGVIKF